MREQIIGFFQGWLTTLLSFGYLTWIYLVCTYIVVHFTIDVVRRLVFLARVGVSPAGGNPGGIGGARARARQVLREEIMPLSLVGGIALAVLGYQQIRDEELKNRTVELLAEINLQPEIAAANSTMAGWIREERRFASAVDAETDNIIITLLDYYEFLAVAMDEGALDEELFLYVRCGPMARAYDVTGRYIAERREELGAPNLYGKLEEVVETCLAREQGT